MKIKDVNKFGFGKKTNNEYKIVERKFQDNNTLFFIKEIKGIDSSNLELQFEEIREESFNTLEEAKQFVEELKEVDKQVTVLEEKIHDC
jgi:hypothetical protein